MTGPNGICDSIKARADIQAIQVGKGFPNAVAITAGANDVIDSAAGGDDVSIGGTISTGPNGICESLAAGDDGQAVAVGAGSPNAVCITAGVNIVTTASGDDQLMNEVINAGANGKCETTVVGNDVQVIPNGQGKPNTTAITSGVDGVLSSTIAGDDATHGSPSRPTTPAWLSDYPYTVNFDAWDLPGAQGQGNSNPPQAFTGHWIVRWDDGGTKKYYDPSYGSAMIEHVDADALRKAYEDANLAGYSARGAGWAVRKNNSLTAYSASSEVSEDNAD